ncbi:MAG: TRAP transporter small permease [Desulfobacterales bacterium]|nr:MAG: TRAP transporter small permease [Desulfobacterales bacterium]
MRPLIKAYDIGALICFCAMMGCVLLEVVARNIVHFPTTWAEELSRFMCVWTVFLGAAAAWARNTHIVIDILPRRLKDLPKRLLTLMNQTLSGIFILCVWVGAISIMIAQYEAKTTALEISISWFYLGLAVGATGMLIFHLHLMIRTVRNPTDLETMVS